MLRADYLREAPVIGFLAYLRGVVSLLDAAKAYAYAIKPTVWGALFPCAPGARKDNLADNSRVLAELQSRLRESWRARQEDGAVSACRLILQWGGVYDRGRKGDRNCDRLEEIRRRPGHLLAYLDPFATFDWPQSVMQLGQDLTSTKS